MVEQPCEDDDAGEIFSFLSTHLAYVFALRCVHGVGIRKWDVESIAGGRRGCVKVRYCTIRYTPT